MTNTILLDPTANEEIPVKYLSKRLESLNGKVMGLLDITKNGSDIFLNRLEELICYRFEISDVIRVKKPTFSRPAPVELLSDLADRADFVIEGLAD
ncbi:hypothetical protein C6497_10660 [Candidatus Poribacteria bacterium]|nr:MAG: hypothetical protein C6497_10660 [Candidatus Poribacteria bacterium]